MVFAIRLSCILAICFCLAITGGASNADSQIFHQLVLLSERTTDPDIRLQAFYHILRIYKRLRGGTLSDLEKETKLNKDLHRFERRYGCIDELDCDTWESDELPARFLRREGPRYRTKFLALVNGIIEYLQEKYSD